MKRYIFQICIRNGKPLEVYRTLPSLAAAWLGIAADVANSSFAADVVSITLTEVKE